MRLRDINMIEFNLDIDKDLPNTWIMTTKANGDYEITITRSGCIRVYSKYKNSYVCPRATPQLSFDLGNVPKTADNILALHLFDTDINKLIHINGIAHDMRFKNLRLPERLEGTDTLSICAAIGISGGDKIDE